MAISTVPDPSGSGRVDMLTSPVAAARAAVATGAWVKIETRHLSDTWKCGSLSFVFTHPAEDNVYPGIYIYIYIYRYIFIRANECLICGI